MTGAGSPLVSASADSTVRWQLCHIDVYLMNCFEAVFMKLWKAFSLLPINELQKNFILHLKCYQMKQCLSLHLVAILCAWPTWIGCYFDLSRNNFGFFICFYYPTKKIVYSGILETRFILFFLPLLVPPHPHLPWWLPTPSSPLSVLMAHAF